MIAPAFKCASVALCRQRIRPYRRGKPKSSGMNKHGPKFRLGNRIGRWRRQREDEKERIKAAARKHEAYMKAMGFDLD